MPRKSSHCMPSTEMEGKPRPMIPSNIEESRSRSTSSVASTNGTFFTVRGPTCSVSLDTKPFIAPLPYVMLKARPSFEYDFDVLELYTLWLAWRTGEPCLSEDEGTHRLALPVSKMTLNFCGGVPT